MFRILVTEISVVSKGLILMSNSVNSNDFRDGMPFLGGALWLDLINSSFQLDGKSYDFLADAPSFVRWIDASGLPTVSGEIEPERQAALALRELARAIHDSLARSEVPNAALIASLNDLLRKKTTQEQLQETGGSLSLQLAEQFTGPTVAARIASDLAHFLANYDSARLKSCDNPACSMTFYDRGKNNRRRWCTMSICGNRDKVANYRARANKATV